MSETKVGPAESGSYHYRERWRPSLQREEHPDRGTEEPRPFMKCSRSQSGYSGESWTVFEPERVTGERASERCHWGWRGRGPKTEAARIGAPSRDSLRIILFQALRT